MSDPPASEGNQAIQVDVIERNLLEWLDVSLIGFTVGFTVMLLRRFNKIIPILIFLLSIIFLVIIVLDYYSRRKDLEDRDVTIPARLDYLAWLLIVIITLQIGIVIYIWITYETHLVN
jgi:hypothetical protein